MYTRNRYMRHEPMGSDKINSQNISNFRELSIYVLLNCNMLTTMQSIIDFVVTKGLSRVVQKQMQDTLHLTFNISSQLINNFL